MAREDDYENLRQIMNRGTAVKLPKFRATFDMLSSIYNEQEVKVMTVFEKPNLPLPVEEISDLTHFPKEMLTKLLNDMTYKGKIIKIGNSYAILPFIPGLFEVYFTHNRDSPEKMARAAKAYQELFRSGHPFELSAGQYSIYRVIPAADPTEKTVELNKSVTVEHQVLPYEVMKQYISKANLFAVVPCSCRNAAKLAGEPCKRTDENFCVTTGVLAMHVLSQGVGRKVDRNELLEIMKKAEKSGLVHETMNAQETSTFICNCCPCCCGFLKSVKEQKNYGAITKANFLPRTNEELCNKCEDCVKICPMEARYHHWPHADDLSDDKIMLREDLCIGCGICASNCPSEAITLEKVRDVVPVKTQAEMEQKVKVERIH